MNEWRYLPFNRYDAAENMAIDEAVLRENQRRGSDARPTLRFYGWTKPTISLGYFQDVATEVNIGFCRRNNIPIIRRPTGGKAVLHHDDLTYSVIALEDNHLFPAGLLGTYKVISRCIAAGLEKLGVRADMLQEGRESESAELSAFCFSVPSQYELLVEKRKICGSAQIRSRGVFLQHGSLLMNFDPVQTCRALVTSDGPVSEEASKLQQRVTSFYEYADRRYAYEDVCGILKRAFEESLGIRLVDGVLTEEEETVKERLLEYKYRDSRWNMEGKRPHEY